MNFIEGIGIIILSIFYCLLAYGIVNLMHKPKKLIKTNTLRTNDRPPLRFEFYVFLLGMALLILWGFFKLVGY